MIVVYPALVSNNVSSNILPGITKVLEKFVLVYKMDDIIKNANKIAKGKKLFKIGKKLKLKECEIIDEQPIISEAKDGAAIPIQVVGSPIGKKDHSGSGDGAGIIKIDTPNFNAISLEPTWIKIDTSQGTRLIGIKVIPFPVQSDGSLVNSILGDHRKGKIKSFMSSIGRKVIRGVWAALRTLRVPFIRWTVTGDPRKDIIWAKTAHKDNIFLIMNLLDLGTEFFERTDKIKMLYRLGWSSFVVSDDVNKRAYFCMKEFNGMCSAVQYNFMYTSIGSEHGRVFNDLEDIKKSASPFFKLKTKASSLIGKRMAISKKNRYGK